MKMIISDKVKECFLKGLTQQEAAILTEFSQKHIQTCYTHLAYSYRDKFMVDEKVRLMQVKAMEDELFRTIEQLDRNPKLENEYEILRNAYSKFCI